MGGQRPAVMLGRLNDWTGFALAIIAITSVITVISVQGDCQDWDRFGEFDFLIAGPLAAHDEILLPTGGKPRWMYSVTQDTGFPRSGLSKIFCSFAAYSDIFQATYESTVNGSLNSYFPSDFPRRISRERPAGVTKIAIDLRHEEHRTFDAVDMLRANNADAKLSCSLSLLFQQWLQSSDRSRVLCDPPLSRVVYKRCCRPCDQRFPTGAGQRHRPLLPPRTTMSSITIGHVRLDGKQKGGKGRKKGGKGGDDSIDDPVTPSIKAPSSDKKSTGRSSSDHRRGRSPERLPKPRRNSEDSNDELPEEMELFMKMLKKLGQKGSMTSRDESRDKSRRRRTRTRSPSRDRQDDRDGTAPQGSRRGKKADDPQIPNQAHQTPTTTTTVNHCDDHHDHNPTNGRPQQPIPQDHQRTQSQQETQHEQHPSTQSSSATTTKTIPLNQGSPSSSAFATADTFDVGYTTPTPPPPEAKPRTFKEWEQQMQEASRNKQRTSNDRPPTSRPRPRREADEGNPAGGSPSVAF